MPVSLPTGRQPCACSLRLADEGPAAVSAVSTAVSAPEGILWWAAALVLAILISPLSVSQRMQGEGAACVPNKTGAWIEGLLQSTRSVALMRARQPPSQGPRPGRLLHPSLAVHILQAGPARLCLHVFGQQQEQGLHGGV